MGTTATTHRPAIATPEELLAERQRLGLTQTELATALGMTLRGYQDVEGGKSAGGVRVQMSLAIEMIGMRMAVSRAAPTLARETVAREARELVKLVDAKSTAWVVTVANSNGVTIGEPFRVSARTEAEAIEVGIGQAPRALNHIVRPRDRVTARKA